MGFSEIISKLISDFELEKKKIEDDWDSKIKERKNEIDKQIEKIYESKAKEIEKQIEENHHSRFLNAKLNQKNFVLRKKRQLIEEIFKKAYSDLSMMDDEKYLTILIELIVKYSEDKEQIIYLSSKDFEKYKDNLQKKLNEKKIKIKSIEKSDKFEKGLVLYNPDKKIETNLSFESIMRRKKEQLENHIGKMLHVV